jgi:lipopolysaccharide export system permease protein
MGLAIGRTGAWLKEHRQEADGVRSITVKVRGVGSKGELDNVRIFEVDEAGRLVRSITAARAVVARAKGVHEWMLANAQETVWEPGAASAPPRIVERKAAQLAWPTSLDAKVVGAAVLPIQSMGAIDLYRYSTHLAEEEQAVAALSAAVLEARAVPVHLPRDGRPRAALRVPQRALGRASA